MHNQVYQHEKRKQKKTSSDTPEEGALQQRPFTMQLKTLSQQPDFKTSFSRAERYGHHIKSTKDTHSLGVKQRADQPVIQCVRMSNMLPGNLKFSTKFPHMKNKRTDDNPIGGPTMPNAGASVDENKLPPGGTEIPQNMHFFWKGDAPGRDDKEWQHLQQWGNMKDREGWGMNLWTDQASHEAWKENHADKLEQLAKMNINVAAVENHIDPRNKHVYDYAIANNAPTMASDVARYSILKNQGGIYADLDMTPGDLALPKPTDSQGKQALSSGRLPFFGPRIQSVNSVKQSTPGSTEPFNQRLQQTIGMKYEQGAFNNNLIAAEPNNPTIDKMIEKISNLQEGDSPSDLKPDKKHLGEIASTVTGPLMAGKVMAEQMGLQPHPMGMVPQATGYMNPNLRERLTKINLLSEASEDLGETA